MGYANLDSLELEYCCTESNTYASEEEVCNDVDVGYYKKLKSNCVDITTADGDKYTCCNKQVPTNAGPPNTAEECAPERLYDENVAQNAEAYKSAALASKFPGLAVAMFLPIAVVLAFIGLWRKARGRAASAGSLVAVDEESAEEEMTSLE